MLSRFSPIVTSMLPKLKACCWQSVPWRIEAMSTKSVESQPPVTCVRFVQACLSKTQPWLDSCRIIGKLISPSKLLLESRIHESVFTL
eukprot:4385206-Amphidinium_carterae.1